MLGGDLWVADVAERWFCFAYEVFVCECPIRSLVKAILSFLLILLFGIFR